MLSDNEDSLQARDYQRIASAIGWLTRHAEEQPALAELAGALNLSESHLQRLFTRLAGVSPKRFVQHLTLSAAKARLADGGALLPHAYALGLSGGGRLHDLFVTLEAMTPGEYRAGGAGLTLRWGVHATRFGPVVIALSPRGVCLAEFVDDDAPAVLRVAQRWPNARLVGEPAATAAIATRLFEPLAAASGQPLPLLVKGSNFQLQVWRALLTIPYGELASYRQIAAAIGQPGASRAVGNAVGANPLAWLIPCHRVIRTEGALGDYRWGLERKAALIGWEAAEVDRAAEPATAEEA
ncbi:methylated-DNA--[protein]-cysteine S-methyltransferase [Crenobacter sp. SG2305]|uniref:methylated-DNA--[protein]-cysteine S-methyltransferase n=1 Tax=Crenobacter oryzisoli TaxID=3056844 RepID=UPI0025AAE372|nr:methylated-DNA--[protein]-cysteine S-methyltransferase [Crenobacter sp. SG2305]MDN0081305.1 methylated-DNA--[protein]-cysteine S-methyltransferase [Crenobacter sp. SG2305]